MANNIKINDHTAEVRAAMDKAIDKALEMCGLKAEGYAKMICPVDTGNLRNSITHTPGEDKSEYIGTNVEYGPYVELGTSRTKAQPYLRPAVQDHINEYARMIAACLNEI